MLLKYVEVVSVFTAESKRCSGGLVVRLSGSDNICSLKYIYLES